MFMATPPWPQQQRDAAVVRGPHKSVYDDREFISKKSWIFVPKGIGQCCRMSKSNVGWICGCRPSAWFRNATDDLV